MATPQMQTQSININPTARFAATQSAEIPTKALSDGTPIDVHTGYAIDVRCFPAANPNPGLDTGTSIMGLGITATFSTTGVTVKTNGVGLADSLPYLNAKLVIMISNDSFSTQQVLATGGLNLPAQ